MNSTISSRDIPAFDGNDFRLSRSVLNRIRGSGLDSEVIAMDVLTPLLKSSPNAEAARTALRPDRTRCFVQVVRHLLMLVCGAILLLQGQVAADETPKRETNSPGETALAELDVTELSIDPRQITLQHADDSAQLLVTARLADGTLRDVTHHVEWIVDQPDVAAIKSGYVKPQGTGHASMDS